MKRISLKFVVGFLAFAIGVFGTAFWFFNPFPSDPLKNVPIVQVENNTDEEYEVYSVLINELFVKKDTSRNSLNISSQTSFYNNTDYLKKTRISAKS